MTGCQEKAVISDWLLRILLFTFGLTTTAVEKGTGEHIFQFAPVSSHQGLKYV